jgi:hypothetical protein
MSAQIFEFPGVTDKHIYPDSVCLELVREFGKTPGDLFTLAALPIGFLHRKFLAGKGDEVSEQARVNALTITFLALAELLEVTGSDDGDDAS